VTRRYVGLGQQMNAPVINMLWSKDEDALSIRLSTVTGRYKNQHLLRVCKKGGETFERAGGWKREV
jgi:hypothetical protein